jgi:hypothetical protein
MSETPPTMFRRPTDPPDPLPPLRETEQLVRLHAEWARLHAPSSDSQSLRSRVGARARAARLRLGGADRRYIGDVVRAVDVIALRCDELSERVTQMTVSADDVARVLGEEVTELRAVVERLRTLDQSSPQLRNQ